MADQENSRQVSLGRVWFANLLALAGVIMLERGLWMFSPAVALIIGGALAILVAVAVRSR